MHRIFVEMTLELNTQIKLNDEQAHHLFNVLRMNPGDKIEVVDADGNVFIATFLKPSKCVITSKIDVITEPSADITIFQGIPKKDKFEQIIKMGTEIGANKFIPVQMRRSVVKIKPEKVERLVSRWNKIILSAAKQSKRQEIPIVDCPIGFDDMIKRFEEYDLIICLYENENKTALKDINVENVSKIALIIGPEGGISNQEVKQIKDKGVTFCSLGPRIMRTETAGVVALSIVLYLTGDI